MGGGVFESSAVIGPGKPHQPLQSGSGALSAARATVAPVAANAQQYKTHAANLRQRAFMVCGRPAQAQPWQDQVRPRLVLHDRLRRWLTESARRIGRL